MLVEYSLNVYIVHSVVEATTLGAVARGRIADY